MITFDSALGVRGGVASGAQVARYKGATGTYTYIVVGTTYGTLKDTGGDWRTWKSYSGARRACRAYINTRVTA